jgi:hypothetical protein
VIDDATDFKARQTTGSASGQRAEHSASNGTQGTGQGTDSGTGFSATNCAREAGGGTRSNAEGATSTLSTLLGDNGCTVAAGATDRHAAPAEVSAMSTAKALPSRLSKKMTRRVSIISPVKWTGLRTDFPKLTRGICV